VAHLRVESEHNVENQQRPARWIDELTLSVEDERPHKRNISILGQRLIHYWLLGFLAGAY
jgi:hypothetical protein